MDFNLLNSVRAILQGRKKGASEPSDALLAPDNSIVTWNRLVALRSGREDVVRADALGLLRTRPFEPYEVRSPLELTAVFQTAYTVPAGVVARLQIEIVNGSLTEGTVTIHLVPDGGGETPGNAILFAVPVPVNKVGIRLGNYLMGAGGTVRARASVANIIAVHVFPEEYGLGDTP